MPLAAASFDASETLEGPNVQSTRHATLGTTDAHASLMWQDSRGVVRLCAIILAAGAGCGVNLPQPSLTEQPADGFRPVPYAPPACLAEVVPPPNDARLVWFDGHWVWRAGGYAWKRGGWVLPPREGRYARWQLRYNGDGMLSFAEGAWLDADGNVIKPQPRVLIAAHTPPNELTSEHAPP
jgi:hypothetical protein